MNMNIKFKIINADIDHIPDLVRMRLLLQNHMENSNDNILKYTPEWRNNLNVYFKN